MKDVDRLIAQDDDLGAHLLRSAREDGPSAAARQKTAIALGLGAAVKIAGAGTAAAAATSKAGTLGVTSLVVKLIGAAVVTSAVVAGTVAFVRPSFVAPSIAAPATLPATTTAQAALPSTNAAPDRVASDRADLASPPAPAPIAIPEPAVIPSPSPVASPASKGSSHASREVIAAPAASTLHDEVRALDDARRLVANGNSAAALRTLDTYDRAFPGGALNEEAAVVRIEALVAAKRDDAAQSVATRFLAAHPDSAQAPRVRSLLARLGTATP